MNIVEIINIYVLKIYKLRKIGIFKIAKQVEGGGSVLVQWLGLGTFIARPGFNPGWELDYTSCTEQPKNK